MCSQRSVAVAVAELQKVLSNGMRCLACVLHYPWLVASRGARVRLRGLSKGECLNRHRAPIEIALVEFAIQCPEEVNLLLSLNAFGDYIQV